MVFADPADFRVKRKRKDGQILASFQRAEKDVERDGHIIIII